MVTPELQSFINQHLQVGTSREEIKSQLLSSGWMESDINQALGNPDIKKPTPSFTKNKFFIAIIVIASIFIVAPVVGIFVSTVLVSKSNVDRASLDAERKQAVVAYRSALEDYREDNAGYPVSTLDSTCPGGVVPCSPSGIFTSSGALASAGYLTEIKSDPKNGQASCKLGTERVTQYCAYKYIGSSTSFIIWTILETPSTAGGVFFLDSTGVVGTVDTEPTKAP